MKKIIFILLSIYSQLSFSDNILLTEQEKIAHKAALGEMMMTMYDKNKWQLSEEGNGSCIINNDTIVPRYSDIDYHGVQMRCVLFKTGTDLGKRKLFMLMPRRVVLECESKGATFKKGNEITYNNCFY